MALWLQGVHVSGAGRHHSSTVEHGIRVAGTSTGGVGLAIGGLSTDFEVAWVEVGNVGNSAIMAKNDPVCTDTNPTSFRGGFVQRNVLLHDNYLHDTLQEGFYLGYSHGSGWTIDCAGTPTLVYSHPLDNTQIYRNRIERTAREGVQVGLGTNTLIHHNFVKDFGREKTAAQNNGIQLGDKSGGRIEDNFVWNSDPDFGVGSGIILLGGTSAVQVHNNTVLNAGTGIYVSVYVTAPVDLINNTLINPIGSISPAADGMGIQSYNDVSTIRVVNNLIVLGTPRKPSSLALSAASYVTLNSVYDQKNDDQHAGSQLQGFTGANITQSGNSKHGQSELLATFVDAPGLDFHLAPASSARNAGVDATAFGLSPAMSLERCTSGVADEPRVAGPAIDVGAWEGP